MIFRLNTPSRIVDDLPSGAVEQLLHNVVAPARGNPIDLRLWGRERPEPAVLTSHPKLGIVGVDDGLVRDLSLQRLVEGAEGLGRPTLHLQLEGGGKAHSVSPVEVVHDLRGAQAHETQLDDPGDEGEPVLPVGRVGAPGLDPPPTPRTVVPSDLDVGDEGLRRRELADRPTTVGERFTEPRTAISAVL